MAFRELDEFLMPMLAAPTEWSVSDVSAFLPPLPLPLGGGAKQDRKAAMAAKLLLGLVVDSLSCCGGGAGCVADARLQSAPLLAQECRRSRWSAVRREATHSGFRCSRSPRETMELCRVPFKPTWADRERDFSQVPQHQALQKCRIDPASSPCSEQMPQDVRRFRRLVLGCRGLRHAPGTTARELVLLTDARLVLEPGFWGVPFGGYTPS
jgi:hypothetical protein